MLMILMYWLLNYLITCHMHRSVIDQELTNLFSQKAVRFLFIHSTDTLIYIQEITIIFPTPNFVYDLSCFHFYKQQSRNGYFT